MRSVHSHPTAEIVFKEVSKELPALTLATVYRNLNQMAEQGQILRIEVNGEYHYDAHVGLHQHCVCDKCGKIVDIYHEDLSRRAIEKAEQEGFSPVSVAIIFWGVCKNCKKGVNNENDKRQKNRI